MPLMFNINSLRQSLGHAQIHNLHISVKTIRTKTEQGWKQRIRLR